MILFFLVANNAQAQIEITFTTSDYNGYNVSCFGSQDGWVAVHVAGGTPPYKYLWSTKSADTTDSIAGLSADYYGIIVIDADSVVAEAGINLTTPWALKTELSSHEYANKYNVSCYGCFNGSITTTVGGGATPYSYLWNDSITTANRSGLGGGYFVLMVFDANGCKMADKIFLAEPNGGWTINGNMGIDPATQFVGTTDAKDFVVKTNGSERMRIGSSGTITMPSGSYFEKLLVNRISTEDSVIYLGDSSMVVGTLVNQIYSDGTGTYKGIGICGQIPQVRSGNSFAYGLNSISIGNWVNSRGTNSISIGSGGKGFNGAPLPLENYDDNTLYIGFNSTIPTIIVKPAAAQNSTGSVGIATQIIPAGYKLAVNGKIICTEVKVKTYTSWDRVFSGDYPLTSINELKKYIFTNHHLQGIPSYSEMQKEEGVSVGDMQMSLLRTVEEQALYIIQLNDRLSEIEADNKVLKDKIEANEKH